MMNNAFCISARGVRMISAPRKLKSVMYELTPSITSLLEALQVLSGFLSRSHSEVSEFGLFVSAGCISEYNRSSTEKFTSVK